MLLLAAEAGISFFPAAPLGSADAPGKLLLPSTRASAQHKFLSIISIIMRMEPAWANC